MKKIFILEGLDCANCATKIENAIKKIENVNDCIVNFMTRKLILEIEKENLSETIEKCHNTVKKIDGDIIIKKG